MSQAANGVISGEGATFDSTFIIDGLEYKFSGEFNGVFVPKFESSNVILTYGKKEDLVGPMQFQGDLGINAVTMNIIRGIMITGPLDRPMNRAYTISGSGRWKSSLITPTVPQAVNGEIYGGGVSFLATFSIDGHRYECEGEFTNTFPPRFRSSLVVLTYLKTEDLVGRMLFQGDIGVKTVRVNMATIAKGITISGHLDEDLDSSYLVLGNGNWRSS